EWRWRLPRGQGHRRPDGHLLHRRRQAHLRLRDGLRLRRFAAPGRLARSRFAPAYARSARAYAGSFSALVEPAPVEILGVAAERASVALDRRVVARLEQHLDQRAHGLARPAPVVVEHRVEDAQRLEVGKALDPLSEDPLGVGVAAERAVCAAEAEVKAA